MGDKVKLITANCTAWASLKDDIEQNEEFIQAHVIMVQEAKIEAKDIVDLEAWCRVRGWMVACEPCLRGVGRSAGVCILWKPFLVRVSNPVTVIAGRAVAVALQLPAGPAFYMSYYATSSCRMKRAHEMEQIVEWCSRQRLPVIIGGGFNEDGDVTAKRLPSSLSLLKTGRRIGLATTRRAAP